MELMFDNANLETIKEFASIYPFVGVTSNPTIIKREGKIDFFNHFRELAKIIGPEKSLHIQVVSQNAEDMIKEAEKIVEKLKKEGVKPALVFDEGGGITTNAFPGVKEDTAFLGVVEKGMVNYKLSITYPGGHSSTPKKNGPTVQMAKAIAKLENNPMKPRFTKTTKELVNVMGRHTIFLLKIVFANMWLFKGLVKKLFANISTDTKALVTSTFAFTTIHGGTVTNSIPEYVEANINVRIAPFDTKEKVLEHIKKTINNENIKVEMCEANKMYKECDYNSVGYKKIKDTVLKTYDNVVVAPFITFGGTDARHYNEISDCVIRFSPIKLTSEERKGMHGVNEQISVEAVKKALIFYENLLEIL